MENNFNQQYNYNPYTNPQEGFHASAQSTENQQGQASGNFATGEQVQGTGKHSFQGFGVTMVKTVTIALVFGLVAGIAGTTVLKFSNVSLGIFEDANKTNAGIANKDSEKTDTTVTLQQTTTSTDVSVTVMDVSDIVESAMPCVVAVSNISEETYKNVWGQTYTEEYESVGTGFIVEQDDEYIYIATNNHVVEGATELSVQFCDDEIVTAEVKGTVPSKDLAVIKVALNDIGAETLSAIRIATLGDSSVLEVGEGAIAIGNALGYGQSVTTGVISALGRSVTVQDSMTGTVIVNNNLIQTDAAINPGNSGGALLNVKGEVIGINSVKYADTNVEGIGYAIPISDAMLIIEKLIEGEKVDESHSGYLGIKGTDSNLGAYVKEVFEGSAAEDAGIQEGDIIIEFEGNSISTMNHLVELLSYYPAGEEVHLVILREDVDAQEYVEMEITVVLGDSSTIPLE